MPRWLFILSCLISTLFLLTFTVFLFFFSFFLIEKSIAERPLGTQNDFFSCFHWLLRKSWLCSSSPAFHGAPDWLPRSPSGSAQHLHRIGRFDMMEEKTGRRCAPSKSHLGALSFASFRWLFSPSFFLFVIRAVQRRLYRSELIFFPILFFKRCPIHFQLLYRRSAVYTHAK